jgi:hypothetical protein
MGIIKLAACNFLVNIESVYFFSQFDFYKGMKDMKKWVKFRLYYVAVIIFILQFMIACMPVNEYYLKNDTSETLYIKYSTVVHKKQDFYLEPKETRIIKTGGVYPNDTIKLSEEDLKKLFIELSIHYVKSENNKIQGVEAFKEKDIELIKDGTFYKYFIHIRKK